MALSDNETWKITRKAFTDYREVKRKLRLVIKEHDKAYHRHQRSIRKCIEIQSRMFSKRIDPKLPEKLSQACEIMQQREKEHIESYEVYSNTLKEFRDAEMNYCVTVFKVLRDVIDLPLTQIAILFGLWDANIDRWISEGADVEKLCELYDKEFGELSRLQGFSDDES